MDILGDFAEARLQSATGPGFSLQTNWSPGSLLVLVLKEGQPQVLIPGKYTVTSLMTNGTPSAPLFLGIHTHTDAEITHSGNQSQRNSSPWGKVPCFSWTLHAWAVGLPRHNARSAPAALLNSIFGGQISLKTHLLL